MQEICTPSGLRTIVRQGGADRGEAAPGSPEGGRHDCQAWCLQRTVAAPLPEAAVVPAPPDEAPVGRLVRPQRRASAMPAAAPGARAPPVT